MPAGDLVVADWTYEIRTTLFGDGTNYKVDDANIDGLGVAPVRTADVDLEQADGAYGSPDWYGPRVILIPLIFNGSASDVGGWLKTWQTTIWVKSTTDIPLYMQLPGYGKFYVNGRPRGFDPDVRFLKFGLVTAEATFVALDPTITYV